MPTKVKPLEQNDLTAAQWNSLFERIRASARELKGKRLNEVTDHFLERGVRCNDTIIAEACRMCRVVLR